MPKLSNPVVEIYKGIDIRKSNVYPLRLPDFLLKELIDESERTGLPISKILVLSSRPCHCCKNLTIPTENKNGEMIEIKRGILYRNHIQNSGTSILEQNIRNAKS